MLPSFLFLINRAVAVGAVADDGGGGAVLPRTGGRVGRSIDVSYQVSKAFVPPVSWCIYGAVFARRLLSTGLDKKVGPRLREIVLPGARENLEAGFTQPWAHLLADLCVCRCQISETIFFDKSASRSLVGKAVKGDGRR